MGAYLLAPGRHEEAIRWPERATAAPRYYTNGMISRAREYFEQALRLEPHDRLGSRAVERFRRSLHYPHLSSGEDPSNEMPSFSLSGIGPPTDPETSDNPASRCASPLLVLA